MTGFLAVVKYPVDADLKIKRRELLEGLGYIAMELVAEHGFSIAQIEDAFADAQSEAEAELDAKVEREGGD